MGIGLRPTTHEAIDAYTPTPTKELIAKMQSMDPPLLEQAMPREN
jgi:hypothetical protein